MGCCLQVRFFSKEIEEEKKGKDEPEVAEGGRRQKRRRHRRRQRRKWRELGVRGCVRAWPRRASRT
jgi:hypothetical protein